VRVLWLVSLTQRLSRCLWTMVRPSRRRAPFGLQGGLIPLLVRADRRVMRAHTMENLQPKVCNKSLDDCFAMIKRYTMVHAECTESMHEIDAPHGTLGTSYHYQTRATLSSNIGALQHDKRSPR